MKARICSPQHFVFHSKTCHCCYLTTGATLAPQLKTELVSWARAERLRVTSNEIAYIRRGMMWMHTWGSPHNSNPKWPFAVGQHKEVMIAGKLSQRLCPPPGMIKIAKDAKRSRENLRWRPQQFQTGGTQHGARRLPGSHFLVDLEMVKQWQWTLICVNINLWLHRQFPRCLRHRPASYTLATACQPRISYTLTIFNQEWDGGIYVLVHRVENT